jgi:hypothetical protein
MCAPARRRIGKNTDFDPQNPVFTPNIRLVR